MSQFNKSKIELPLIGILVSFWLMFSGCVVGEDAKLVKFYSHINRHEVEDIKDILEKLKDTDELMYLKILCLRDKEFAENEFGDQCYCSEWMADLNKNRSLLDDEPLSMEYTFFEIENLLLNDVVNPVGLEKLEDIKWNENTEYETFLKIRFLLNMAINLENLDKLEETKIYLDYALHLIEKHDFEYSFPREVGFLHLILAHFFILETEESQSLNSSKQALRISKKNKLKDLEIQAQFFIIECMNISVSEKLLKFKKLLNEEQISSSMRLQLLSSILKEIDIKENREYFEYLVQEIEEYYDEKSCDKFENDLYTEIAYKYLSNDDFDNASIYYGKVKLDNRCNLVHRKWSQYYFNSEMSFFYEMKYFHENNNEYLDSAIFYLKEQFREMPILFGDVTTEHFDHAFMSDAYRFLSLVSNYEVIPDNILQDLLSYIYNAKGQELKIDRFLVSKSTAEMKGELGKLNKRIGEYKIKLEELKKGDYYNSKLHEKLFNTINERNSLLETRDQLKNNYVAKKIDLDVIRKYLVSNNIQIVEYIEYETELVAYHLTENEMEISFLNKTKIDSLINLCISKPKEISTIKEFQSLFIPFDLPAKLENILIFKDGSLNRFSFDLLEIDKNIYYHHDIIEVLNEEVKYISLDSLKLLSFSDKETIDSDMNRDHVDLEFGYYSSDTIVGNLGIGSNNFIKGWDFTYKNFLEALKFSAVHLVTHAIGDDNIKNNGKLLFRKDKFYYDYISTNTLDFLDNYPQFVYLDACQTGIGKNFIGEGNYSIDRAFLKNGTSTVIKTLWPILDESAGYLATKYYENWLDGQSCSTALRNAKIEVREKYSDPYHWAPFVLEGNPNIYLSPNLKN